MEVTGFMKQLRKKKCRHCGSLFRPDSRNHKKQRYCSKPDCRKASKAESQRKWVRKNPKYFRSPENVIRVQQWRKNNPGYSRKKQNALQDLLIGKDKEKQGLKPHLATSALQDLLTSQPAVFIGLIAHLTGCALQDDIASSIARMVKLGKDILNSSNFTKGGSYDSKTSYLSGKSSLHPGTIQLDRSSPDP